MRIVAKTHRFAYSIYERVRDVYLGVRLLDTKTGIYLRIPKGNLEYVLDEVPEIIDTLKRMQNLHVTFQRSSHVGNWIEPEDDQ